MDENLNTTPKSFLTGQKALTQLLGDVRGGTVRQAYIFEGLRGTENSPRRSFLPQRCTARGKQSRALNASSARCTWQERTAICMLSAMGKEA